MAQYTIYSIIFYTFLLIIKAEKLSSMPEFSGLIEIEKDPISASFISNIEIQLKSNYSPEKILGYLNILEKSMRKQYEESEHVNKDLKISYDLSVARIDDNIESYSNRINELEESIEYLDQTKLLLQAIYDQNRHFQNDIKDKIQSISQKEIESDKNKSRIRIVKKIDGIIESIKLNSTTSPIENFKDMKKDFGLVGADREYLYLSNLKKYEKTKLVGYLYQLKEKFMNKMSLIDKQMMESEKKYIEMKINELYDKTGEIIKNTHKLMISHNHENELYKKEIKHKKDFQNEIIDEKNKLKNLWIVESTNNQSIEKNILDSLNGLRKVRQYFIRNYSKLKRLIQKYD